MIVLAEIPAQPSLWELFGRVVPTLALLAGAAFVVRRWLQQRGPAGLTGNVKVTDRAMLGRSQQACVVEVDDRRLLLGVADGAVRLLTELDPPDPDADDDGEEAADPPLPWQERASLWVQQLRERTVRGTTVEDANR